MDPGAFAAMFFFATVGACIILPVYFRNLLYRKTLDTVAKAIEHGVDPERIAVQLPSLQREKDDDPNGNWKAGVILIAIAIGFLLAISLPAWLLKGASLGEDLVQVLVPPIMLGIVGAVLLLIHRRIIGDVVKYGQGRSRRAEEGG